MSNVITLKPTDKTVEDIVSDLVRIERINGALFVNLPMIYPDGSFVTVRIDRSGTGYNVSDAGFTFREVEDIAGSRSFRRAANRIAQANEVIVGERHLYVESDLETLERAICDVANTSWQIVDTVAGKAFDPEEAGLSDELSERLKAVFGEAKVKAGVELAGNSTTTWPVTAVVEIGSQPVVFQAVSENANSINRASTAFRDLSGLGNRAPKLIAYVRSKQALGSKLSLLSPARIVEETQTNDVLVKAAA